MKPFNCAKKKKNNSGSFKNVMLKMCLEIIYLIYIYKKDVALNNLQCLMCHKTKPHQTKQYYWLVLFSFFVLWHIDGYSIPKPSSRKIWSSTDSREIRGFIAFPLGISPKVNVIAWLVFELVLYGFAVQHVSHNVTSTPFHTTLNTLFVSDKNIWYHITVQKKKKE